MRITALNRSIDRVTTTLVDITEKRRSLTEDKTRKTDLESKILAASYAASLSSKNRELRDLEEKRAALHVELTGLNMQADVRAKLGLKRVEIQRKNDAVQAL
jgi:DNA repair protein RAD50